jgi:hypothetical protein
MQIGAGKGATVYYVKPFPNFLFSTYSGSMKINLARLRRQHISMEKYKTITYQVLFVGTDYWTGCRKT